MIVQKGTDLFAATDDSEAVDQAKAYIRYSQLTGDQVQLGREAGCVIVRTKAVVELQATEETFSDYLSTQTPKEN